MKQISGVYIPFYLDGLFDIFFFLKSEAIWYFPSYHCSLFIFNMQDSYSSTDIKLVLLNGFLVMHVQKASFASNLNFCFPLVTHFAASVFIL